MLLDCLASILWPPRCAGCNAFVSAGAAFCAACERTVLALGSCCPGCAMPWQGGGTCRGCQRKPLPFARAFSALAYGGSLSQSLLRFKHGGNRHIARPLGAYLAPLLSQAVESGAVIACPVPLHPRRLRQRGFNQALELLRAARALAPHSTRIAMDCDVLARTVDTPSLGHGSPAHRQQVVANAFSVVRPRTIAGRCVLVVDDVMTTGATLAECARTLLRSGASQVLVAALARAV